MTRHSFIQMSKLSNVKGRISYITSPERIFAHQKDRQEQSQGGGNQSGQRCPSGVEPNGGHGAPDGHFRGGDIGGQEGFNF